MKEKRTQVRTFIIEAGCSEPGCGGTLEHDGGTLASPPAYRHVCDECSEAERLDTIYPAVKYEPESLLVKV